MVEGIEVRPEVSMGGESYHILRGTYAAEDMKDMKTFGQAVNDGSAMISPNLTKWPFSVTEPTSRYSVAKMHALTIKFSKVRQEDSCSANRSANVEAKTTQSKDRT